ncbi:stage II sporulation protein R [Paenibacillus lentus]|uniref:Stage II sporulation protein R n=1 Tax=Paenibacillus lentus TaxID=1338368 RepID=A0A3Q8S453_9BACL|nr:stage II sporulation protein R [Paenibacillus lentus]AZK45858.1 stage II sporulation protein R [Paenibacillus lentus]
MGQQFRSIALIFCSFMILLMSWEGQKSDAAAIGGSIPEESIRLRILANSDRPGDQVIKRRVRDAIVEQMNGWVQQLEHPLSLTEARQIIENNLALVEDTVKQTLEKSGKTYTYQVELGMVSFPTKMYGGAVYPAGEYEALRVTLGKGEGKNWWCVLFPPLCFVDAGSGEALAKDGDAEVKVQAQQEEAEVRFFLWDMLTGLWNWIVSFFK